MCTEKNKAHFVATFFFWHSSQYENICFFFEIISRNKRKMVAKFSQFEPLGYFIGWRAINCHKLGDGRQVEMAGDYQLKMQGRLK